MQSPVNVPLRLTITPRNHDGTPQGNPIADFQVIPTVVGVTVYSFEIFDAHGNETVSIPLTVTAK